MALTAQAAAELEKLFGAAPTSSPTDPELYEMLQNQIFDETFATGVLEDSDRELITVAVLAAMQTLPQLKAHTAAALNAGNQPLTVREAIYGCAPFIGYPKTLNAVAAFDEVLAGRGISLPLAEAQTVPYDARLKRGSDIQQPLYGDEIAVRLKGLPAPFDRFVAAQLTRACFGDYYTRQGLTLAQREMLAVCVLAALNAQGPIKAHLAGARRAGVTDRQLAAALVQALPYIGFPYALAALGQMAEAAS